MFEEAAREQGVGVYVDGVYLARQHGLAAALLDIERVEVLKGPQGTLFGRNTEGGALSLVTKKPTGVFGMRAIAGVGIVQLPLMISGPDVARGARGRRRGSVRCAGPMRGSRAPARRGLLPAVRALIDFLAERFEPMRVD